MGLRDEMTVGITQAKNSMQMSSKMLDSLRYLSSVICVDQKLSVPIYRCCCTSSLVELMPLFKRIVFLLI